MGNASVLSRAQPQNVQASEASRSTNEIRGRKNSAPSFPTRNNRQETAVSHKPLLSEAAGCAKVRYRLVQAMYNASGGINKPCDRLGSVHQSPARSMRTRAYNQPINPIKTIACIQIRRPAKRCEEGDCPLSSAVEVAACTELTVSYLAFRGPWLPPAG